MIVQSVDGKFYQNPTLILENQWQLMVNEDGIFLKRRGKCKWATAIRGLAKLGVHVKFEEMMPDSKAIFEGSLRHVSVFRVSLRKAIPVPKGCDTVLTSKPADHVLDMMGESLLAWS